MGNNQQYSIPERVSAFIEREKLFPKGTPLLVACSGGIDSMVLTAILRRLGYPVGLAHCNFKLRGDESDGDAQFVGAFCAGQKLPFYSIDFDTGERAAATGLSIQETARILRYEWLESIRKANGYHFIATGHHMNDNAETVVFNLSRQSGLRGLHGILPKRDKIVRPMLCLNRPEVEAFATAHSLSYRDDSSNDTTRYTRNYIRKEIIPALEEINPKAVQAISDLAQKVREAEALMNERVVQIRRKLLRPMGAGYELSFRYLMFHAAGATLLYELLQEFGVGEDLSADIFAGLGRPGGAEYLTGTHRIIRDRKVLYISPLEDDRQQIRRYEDWPDQIVFNDYKIQVRQLPVEKLNLKKSAAFACFDLDTLTLPLVIRYWKRADYFYPLGMTKQGSDKAGKKKLSKYFKDERINASGKDSIPVLLAGDHIIWLVGHRQDDRHKVTEKTRRVLKLKIVKPNTGKA